MNPAILLGAVGLVTMLLTMGGKKKEEEIIVPPPSPGDPVAILSASFIDVDVT